MNFNPAALRKTQQWTIILSLAVSACILWINALNSGIAKQPILFLGCMLVVAIFFSSLFLRKLFEASFSIIEIVVAIHIPLFLLSAAFTFNTIYTFDALTLGIVSVVFFFAGTSLFTTKKDVSLLLRSIEILTAVLCIAGMLQYFWGNDLPLDFFLAEDNRVSSLLGNSTYFGGFLLLVFPLIASQAFYKRSIGKPALSPFLLLSAVVFLLFITQTRSSIIGFGISGIAFIIISLKKKNVARISGLFAVLLAAGALWAFILNPALGKRFTTMFDENQHSTFARRMFFWEGGINAFAASPVFGHGIGSFEQTVLLYRSPDYWIVGSEDIVPHAHNEFIEIGVEYGIIGLLLSGTLVGLILYRGISIARTAKGWEYWIAIGLTCSIIGIAVDSLANVALRQAPITALTWLLMGLLSSTALKREKMYPVHFTMPSSKVLAVVPLGAWMLLGALYLVHELKLFSAEVQLMNGLRNRQRNEVALRYYEQAVAFNPEQLFGQSILTLSRLNAQQWEKSLRSLEDLHRLSSLYPKSYLMEAYALHHLGKNTEALTAIQQELRLRSHPESFDLQASILNDLHEDEQERAALLNLLRNDVKGRINFKYQAASMQLMQLNKSGADKEELFALLDSLKTKSPIDTAFIARLRSGQ